MSVKKSLWLSLALVVLSLLALGCPTEADSSSETASYERTALWAAVVAAETNLHSTPVSAIGGNDIAKTAKWVSPVQYDAFKRVIDDARELAYSLALAADPTPAEVPAIAELTTAQATFDSQKTAGGADPVSAADLITGVSTGNSIVTGNVTVETGKTLSVTGTAVVTIAPGATLATSGIVTITGAKIDVKEGGTFELATGATKGGNFTGTITLESGATSIDRKSGGGSLFTGAGDTGSYVIKAGAIAIVGNNVLVGPSSGNNKGQAVQLTSGIMKVEVTGYSLLKDGDVPGNATLVSNPNIFALKIDGVSTLTVASGADLRSAQDGNFLAPSEQNAKIILLDAKSTLSVYEPATPPNLPPLGGGFSAGSWEDVTINDPVYGAIPAKRIAGPAVLVKDAGGTWVKQ